MVAANRCKPVRKTRVLQFSILQTPLPAWFCSGLVHIRTRATVSVTRTSQHSWCPSSIKGRICMWLLLWCDSPTLTQFLSTFILSPSSNFCDQMRETISFGDIFEVCVYMEKIIFFLLINAILAFFSVHIEGFYKFCLLYYLSFFFLDTIF